MAELQEREMGLTEQVTQEVRKIRRMALAQPGSGLADDTDDEQKLNSALPVVPDAADRDSGSDSDSDSDGGLIVTEVNAGPVAAAFSKSIPPEMVAAFDPALTENRYRSATRFTQSAELANHRQRLEQLVNARNACREKCFNSLQSGVQRTRDRLELLRAWVAEHKDVQVWRCLPTARTSLA